MAPHSLTVRGPLPIWDSLSLRSGNCHLPSTRSPLGANAHKSTFGSTAPFVDIQSVAAPNNATSPKEKSDQRASQELLLRPTANQYTLYSVLSLSRRTCSFGRWPWMRKDLRMCHMQCKPTTFSSLRPISDLAPSQQKHHHNHYHDQRSTLYCNPTRAHCTRSRLAISSS